MKIFYIVRKYVLRTKNMDWAGHASLSEWVQVSPTYWLRRLARLEGRSCSVNLAELNVFSNFERVLHLQMLSEMLIQVLETLTKNCGDDMHLQLIECDILQELVKIVKKKVI